MEEEKGEEEVDLAPTMQRCCNTSSIIRNNWDQTMGRLSDEGFMIMNQIIEKQITDSQNIVDDCTNCIFNVTAQ